VTPPAHSPTPSATHAAGSAAVGHALDPFDKGFRLSMLVHAIVIVAIGLSLLWAQLFKPRPATIFTVVAPPAGVIAGGPLPSPEEAAPKPTAPTGPKLPSPRPAPTPHTPPAAAKPTPPPPPPKAPAAAPKAVKKVNAPTPPKPRKATAEKPKTAEKISFSDFQKKYAPKSPADSKPAPKSNDQPVAESRAPSWEENLASRLDRRREESSQRIAGTGGVGPAGSGVAGIGVAGATDDADALYTGALYTYLNSVWQEPREVGSIRLSARVEFVVNAQGNIVQWRLVRRSGSDTFDRSVIAVFERVKQVTPPPSKMDYRLTITFETRDK
jgi:TonB family protein